MEEMLRKAVGMRVTCELVTGTMLMGTVYKVEQGCLLISDSGQENGDIVAVQHVVRFK